MGSLMFQIYNYFRKVPACINVLFSRWSIGLNETEENHYNN